MSDDVLSMVLNFFVLGSQGCYNDLPQTGCLETTETYSPTALEAGSVKAKLSSALLSLKPPRKGPLTFLVNLGFSWLVDALL